MGRETEKGIPIAMCPIPYLSHLRVVNWGHILCDHPKTARDLVILAKIHRDCVSFVAYGALQPAKPTADVYMDWIMTLVAAPSTMLIGATTPCGLKHARACDQKEISKVVMKDTREIMTDN